MLDCNLRLLFGSLECSKFEEFLLNISNVQECVETNIVEA